jgi:hypothetical protein
MQLSSRSSVELAKVAVLRTVQFAHHVRDDGALTVLEGDNLPFAIARLFFVSAVAGAKRGMHAHRMCSQFMICASGGIEVLCDDGAETRSFLLDRPNLGLLVPPSIWATETYLSAGSVLAVACDRPYKDDDYIRDYEAFQRYRAAQPT